MRYFAFLILFLCSVEFIYAQQSNDPPITGSFKNITFKAFIAEVEKSTNLFFYYDSKTIDTIGVNLELNRTPLSLVLTKLFEGSPIKFAITKDNKVFITTDYTIRPELSSLYTGKESKYEDNKGLFSTQTLLDVKVASNSKIHEFGSKATLTPNSTFILTGFIRNSKTGEPVINATIYSSKDSSISATTDVYGYYTLNLKGGAHTLEIQGAGIRDAHYNVGMYDNGRLDIIVNEKVETLKAVTISAKKSANINRVQMGVERLTISEIKQMPAVFGEADVIRVLTTLPGVKTVGEASTGFNVRGGAADQNLILYNDATIYNPSHFFGMFSSFNPDVIKDIQLYKSSVDAKYGGRLSSVLDISSREGNKKELTGSAGLGLITSRLHLEGPIGESEKTSFTLGARTTYAKWLVSLLPKEYEDGDAGFTDFNVNIHHEFNENSSLYFTGYYSKDNFRLRSDSTYHYTNRNANLKWKKLINKNLTGVFTAGVDNYVFGLYTDYGALNNFDYNYQILQKYAKADFTYYRNSKHTFEFGLNAIHYNLDPGNFKARSAESSLVPINLQTEKALESAIYISDKITFSPQFSVTAGIRMSMFNVLGPRKWHEYLDGIPKSETTVTDSYEKSGILKTYGGPEFRISGRYAFTNSFSVKAGLNTSRQYIHMLSNTTTIAPTDVWKLSDMNIAPQRGGQASLGFFKNLRNNTIETSVEFYYKKMYDYLDYKPGAKLILNEVIEQDVMPTEGKAYGVEFLVKKPVGKLNGWIGYTYSRTLLKMDNPTKGPLINGGSYYPANFDKPHDFIFVGNYKVSHRFSISANVNYSTGRPITLPVGKYYYNGAYRVMYSDRNAHRIPDYFRADLSLNIYGNHKVHQRTHNSWSIGVYNLTGRRNAYSVYFVTENGSINGYRMSIFGSMIPFVNYNIKF